MGLADVLGGYATYLFLSAVGVALLGLLARVARRRVADLPPMVPKRLVAVLALTLAAPVGLLVYSLVGPDIYTPRHLLVSFPAAVVLLAALVTALPRPLAFASTVALLVALSIGVVRALDPYRARPPLKPAALPRLHGRSEGSRGGVRIPWRTRAVHAPSRDQLPEAASGVSAWVPHTEAPRVLGRGEAQAALLRGRGLGEQCPTTAAFRRAWRRFPGLDATAARRAGRADHRWPSSSTEPSHPEARARSPAAPPLRGLRPRSRTCPS